MAERTPGTGPAPTRTNPPFSASSYPSSLGALLPRRLQDHAPNSAHLIGILTFIVSGAVLLAALTVTGSFTVLIFFGPLVVMSSPIWVPVGLVMFAAAAAAAVLSTFGFSFAALAGASWMYCYLMGRQPGSADGLDHTRNRIAETACQSRVKDAAPGA